MESTEVTKLNFFFCLFLLLLQSGRPGILNQIDQYTVDKFPSFLECAFCIGEKKGIWLPCFSALRKRKNTEQSLSKPAGNKLVPQQVSNTTIRTFPHHKKTASHFTSGCYTTFIYRILQNYYLTSKFPSLYKYIIYNSLLYRVWYNSLFQTLN